MRIFYTFISRLQTTLRGHKIVVVRVCLIVVAMAILAGGVLATWARFNIDEGSLSGSRPVEEVVPGEFEQSVYSLVDAFADSKPLLLTAAQAGDAAATQTILDVLQQKVTRVAEGSGMVVNRLHEESAEDAVIASEQKHLQEDIKELKEENGEIRQNMFTVAIGASGLLAGAVVTLLIERWKKSQPRRPKRK